MEQRPQETAPSNWNVPNALTVLRILGVPFFGWFLLAHGGDDVKSRVIAAFIFMALMATDKIDGDLARKHNLVTDFGKIADPIADKALTGMAFIGLSVIGVLWWWVTILMLVREWGVTLLRMVMVRRGLVMPAGRGGKLKTVLQSGAITLYALPLAIWGNKFALGSLWFGHVLMAAALVVAVGTGVKYLADAKQLNEAAKA